MQESQNLSLYFSLAEGKTADLEVVAKTSLAFATAVREISFLIEPDAIVHIELKSGTDGSLSLNTIVKITKSGIQKVTVYAISGAIATFILKAAGEVAINIIAGEVYEYIVERDNTLTPEQVQEIANKAAEAAASRAVRGMAQEFFRQVSRDPNISGIGISDEHGVRPRVLLDREQIDARANPPTVIEPLPDRRVRRLHQVPILIRIANLSAEPKKWYIEYTEGAHWATMKAPDFLEKMRNNNTNIEIGAQLTLTVDLALEEEKHEGVWVVRNVVIEQVHASSSSSQMLLGIPPAGPVANTEHGEDTGNP